MNHPLQKHLVPLKHLIWKAQTLSMQTVARGKSHYLRLFTGWMQSRAESAEPNVLRVWEAIHLLEAGIRTQVSYSLSLGVVACNTESSGEQC